MTPRVRSVSSVAYGIAGRFPVDATIVLPDGTIVRVRSDGGLDEINGVPARKSIASDPTARGAR